MKYEGQIYGNKKSMQLRMYSGYLCDVSNVFTNFLEITGQCIFSLQNINDDIKPQDISDSNGE